MSSKEVTQEMRDTKGGEQEALQRLKKSLLDQAYDKFSIKLENMEVVLAQQVGLLDLLILLNLFMPGGGLEEGDPSERQQTLCAETNRFGGQPKDVSHSQRSRLSSL